MMKLSSIIGFALLTTGLALTAACKRNPSPTESPDASLGPPPQSPPPPDAATSTAPSAPTQPTAALVEVKRPAEPKIDWRALLAQQGPPSLITIEELNGRCEWSVVEPPELEGRLFMVSYLCPRNVIWDGRARQALFALEGIPYLHDWKDTRVTELPSPPFEQAYYGFSTQGAVFACKNETRDDGGYRTTLRLEEDGSWNRIAYENLGMEEMDTASCSSWYDDENTGQMDYDPRYQTGTDCAYAGRPSNAVCPSQAILEDVKTRVKGGYSAIHYIAFSDQSFIAFPIEYGRGVARFAPVFAIQGDAVTQIYNRLPEKPLAGVLLGTEYFLVRAEYDMKHATLFKKGQVEPVKEFAATTTVMWIPGTIPRADVIALTPEGSGDDG